MLLNFISRSSKVLLGWFSYSFSTNTSETITGFDLRVFFGSFCCDSGEIGLVSDFRQSRSSFGFYLISHSRGGFLLNKLLERIPLSSAIVLRDADLFCLDERMGAGRCWMRVSREVGTLELLEWWGMGILGLSGLRDNLSRVNSCGLVVSWCMNNNRLWI